MGKNCGNCNKRDCRGCDRVIKVVDAVPNLCIPNFGQCWDPAERPIGVYGKCCNEPEGLNDDCTGVTDCCPPNCGCERCDTWKSGGTITECTEGPKGCGNGSCWGNCGCGSSKCGGNCGKKHCDQYSGTRKPSGGCGGRGCDSGCCNDCTSLVPVKPCSSCKQTICNSGCPTRTQTGSRTGNSSGGRKPHVKSFTLTVVPKAGVRDENRVVGTDTVFAVNGYPKARIDVTKGETYALTLIQEQAPGTQYEHLLFLTDDLLGGPVGYACEPATWGPSPLPGTFSPTGSGTVLFKVGHDWPSVVYYQDTNYPAVGGMIVVHSKC